MPPPMISRMDFGCLAMITSRYALTDERYMGIYARYGKACEPVWVQSRGGCPARRTFTTWKAPQWVQRM